MVKCIYEEFSTRGRESSTEIVLESSFFGMERGVEATFHKKKNFRINSHNDKYAFHFFVGDVLAPYGFE